MLNIQAELYKKNGANSLSALLDNAASELQATQGKILEMQQEIEQMKGIVMAVAHIGIDFGYGAYELQDETIANARNYVELKI